MSHHALKRLSAAHRDPVVGRGLLDRIESVAERLSKPIALMEVCGTHTHAIAAAGLRRLLPGSIRLISGPGCPVCVTTIPYLDRAQALSEIDGITVCTFGDLLRVPSSTSSLEEARGGGADIRVVYSARDALGVARANPGRRIIFLSVGFETTTPTILGALAEAEEDGVDNFLLLPGNKIIPPALAALADDPTVNVQGLICPGHVSVIIGSDAYRFMASDYGVPCAIAGFAPNDVLRAVLSLTEQCTGERPIVDNLYGRVVRPNGNPTALALMDRFFETADADWRGVGTIPGSGLAFRAEFAHRDASRIPVELPAAREPIGCRCGDVLRGSIEPPDCPLFDNGCTPTTAVGACMVSSEGTCAAWYRHERLQHNMEVIR